MAAQKWPYLNSDFFRARCVTKTYEVSFSPNSGFADLTEWYTYINTNNAYYSAFPQLIKALSGGF